MCTRARVTPGPAARKCSTSRSPNDSIVVDRMLLGERVDRVAHRVGGEQAGVVPVDVRGVEVALEPDVDREVAQVVAARAGATP